MPKYRFYFSHKYHELGLSGMQSPRRQLGFQTSVGCENVMRRRIEVTSYGNYTSAMVAKA